MHKEMLQSALVLAMILGGLVFTIHQALAAERPYHSADMTELMIYTPSPSEMNMGDTGISDLDLRTGQIGQTSNDNRVMSDPDFPPTHDDVQR